MTCEGPFQPKLCVILWYYVKILWYYLWFYDIMLRIRTFFPNLSGQLNLELISEVSIACPALEIS